MPTTAKFDQPKLERSLKRFASRLGETNAQAVIRWSVQTCRELAMETQVFGRSKTRQKQEGAMKGDALNVIWAVDRLQKTKGIGYRATNQGKTYGVSARKVLITESEVNNWIELNRTRRNKGTAKIPIEDRRVCDSKTFKRAMTIRNRMAGAAKGAWIGAGNSIARAQKGEDKQTIGRNFLSYTQKNQRFGSAQRPSEGFKPTAGISNNLSYSGESRVLSKTGINKAIQFGLKKTVAYYSKTLRAIDKKDKP